MNDKRVQQLIKAAESLEEKAQKRRNLFAGQNLTRRRANMISQGVQDAYELEQAAVLARALAEKHALGGAPRCLADIRSQKVLRALVADLETAKRYGTETTYYRNKCQREIPLEEYGKASAWAMFTLNERRNGHQQKQDQIAEAIRDVMLRGIPGFFPTPPELAARMVQLADISDGMSVLDPGAGTGNLLDAVRAMVATDRIHAIELRIDLCDILRLKGYTRVQCADFMDRSAVNLRPVDRIVMNPPFENGQDWNTIRHAYDHYLEPGGRLVTICANGQHYRSDRVQTWLRIWDHKGLLHWEEPLPHGTFAESGTNVASRLIALDKPRA